MKQKASRGRSRSIPGPGPRSTSRRAVSPRRTRSRRAAWSRRRSTGRCRSTELEMFLAAARDGRDAMIQRWGPWIALGVVVVIALAVVLWPNGRPVAAARAHDARDRAEVPGVPGPLGRRQPGADVARDPGRHQAAHRHGSERREIRQAYVDKYGESILLKPQGSGSACSCGSCRSSCSRSAPPASCSRCGAAATSRICTPPKPTRRLVRAGARDG